MERTDLRHLKHAANLMEYAESHVFERCSALGRVWELSRFDGKPVDLALVNEVRRELPEFIAALQDAITELDRVIAASN
jgi:hypothetical protein